MSRNPVLTDKAFGLDGNGATSFDRPSPAQEWENAQRSGAGAATAAGTAGMASTYGRTAPPTGPTGPVETGGRTMSLGGVSSVTMLMFGVLLVGGWWGWMQVTERTVQFTDGSIGTTAELNSPGLLIGALILGLVLALVTIFKPKIARFTALPYSLVQGAMLGMISHLYNAEFEGIVLQAILATFGVFLTMLVLYGLRILRATPKFVKGVVAATFGILIMYVIGWVMSIFMSGFTPFWQTSGPLGIAISVVIVIVAALNLILDFNFIEQGSKHQLPAYMDWYAAFGLMITLIWLYLEMLRLFAKLRSN